MLRQILGPIFGLGGLVIALTGILITPYLGAILPAAAGDFILFGYNPVLFVITVAAAGLALVGAVVGFRAGGRVGPGIGVLLALADLLVSIWFAFFGVVGLMVLGM